MEIIDDIQCEELNKKLELAKQHASQSTTGNGWGSLLCGGVFAAIYFINLFLKPGYADGLLTLGLISMWIIVKERLREKYAPDTGMAEEVGWPFFQQALLVVFALFALYGWLLNIFTATLSPRHVVALIILTLYIVALTFCRSLGDFVSSMLFLLACEFAFGSLQMAFFVGPFHGFYGLVGLLQLSLGLVHIWEHQQEMRERRHK
jgi:cellulose synthase/poly-beta-1,6-N-acetylglucosamine synthase-like glycosyltransferase